MRRNNEYIVTNNDSCLVIHSEKHGKIKVLIDESDIDICRVHKWHYQKSKEKDYIGTKIKIDGKYKNIKLHRFLLEVNDPKDIVDHINGNPLDNRRDNLRITDNIGNSQNKKRRSDNTTGAVGVDFNKNANKWRAKIIYKGITIHLGYYKDKFVAMANRIVAEELLFKEFRYNNYRDIAIPTEVYDEAKENVIDRIKMKVDMGKNTIYI